MLLPDGREVSLGFGGAPRFSGRTVGDGRAWMVTEGDKTRPELGLFRVWSSTFAGAAVLFNDPARPTPLHYPLTPEARRAVQAFDSVEGSGASQRLHAEGHAVIMSSRRHCVRAHGDASCSSREFDVAPVIRMNGGLTSGRLSVRFSTGGWIGGRSSSTDDNLSRRLQFRDSRERAGLDRQPFTPTERRSPGHEIVVTDPVTFPEPVHSRNTAPLRVRCSTRTLRRCAPAAAISESH